MRNRVVKIMVVKGKKGLERKDWTTTKVASKYLECFENESKSSTLPSKQLVADYLAKLNIKRSDRVKLLNLGKLNLRDIHYLSEYYNLEELWLNDNRLRTIEGVKKSVNLKRLYLQHNRLVSLQGALKKVKHLDTLLLHDNQLRDLKSLVRDIKHMSNLKVLNLFGNPIEEEQEYRSYVIHNIPSLQVFDRREITMKERRSALALYNVKKSTIEESVKFGRRKTTRQDEEAVSSAGQRGSRGTYQGYTASHSSTGGLGKRYCEEFAARDAEGIHDRKLSHMEGYGQDELRLLAAGIEVGPQKHGRLTHHRHRISTTLRTMVHSQIPGTQIAHKSIPLVPQAGEEIKGMPGSMMTSATALSVVLGAKGERKASLGNFDGLPSDVLIGGGESSECSESLVSNEGDLSNLSQTEIEDFRDLLEERNAKTCLVFNAFGWQNFDVDEIIIARKQMVQTGKSELS